MAVFGLGDSVSYGEYFCDAMEEVYRCGLCAWSHEIQRRMAFLQASKLLHCNMGVACLKFRLSLCY